MLVGADEVLSDEGVHPMNVSYSCIIDDKVEVEGEL